MVIVDLLTPRMTQEQHILEYSDPKNSKFITSLYPLKPSQNTVNKHRLDEDGVRLIVCAFRHPTIVDVRGVSHYDERSPTVPNSRTSPNIR